MKNKRFFALVFVLMLLKPAAASPNNIIGCVNDSPIYLTEYNRLLKARLQKFEKQFLFDPWQASSLDALQERYKLIEEAKSKNVLIKPTDVLTYKNIFNKKLEAFGSPINTYDLNSYAEENALLLQFFSQEAFKSIQENLIEKALLTQEARKESLKAETWEIESRLQEIKSKYKSEQEFNSFLRNNNSTELELKLALEEQILNEKLKDKLFKNYSQNTNAVFLSAMTSLEHKDSFEQWFEERKRKSQIEFSVCLTGNTCSAPDSEVKALTGAAHQVQAPLFTLPAPKVISEANKNVLSKVSVSNQLKTLTADSDKKPLFKWFKWKNN